MLVVTASPPLPLRSLNPEDVPQCPQQPWMGACRYKSGAGAAEGEALGYVTGDLVEVGEGLLQLGYYNGDAICVGGRRSTVKITFQCAPHTASVSSHCNASSSFFVVIKTFVC